MITLEPPEAVRNMRNCEKATGIKHLWLFRYAWLESFIQQSYHYGMDEKMTTLSELKNVLRSNVRMRRKEQGLTQQALADMIGTSQPSIAQIESGVHTPSFENLVKIAEALAVSPDLLLRPGIFSEISA